MNTAVLDRVPDGVRTVLDVGCGGGSMGAELRRRHGCTVVGITGNEDEAVSARQRLDDVVVADLNEYDPSGLGTFDCVLCSHTLEHLIRPERLLERLRACVRPNGVLLAALPNILVLRARLELARGRFRYTDTGLFDRTHYRFYDWETARELFTSSGFRVESAVADGALPFTYLLGQRLHRLASGIALERFPGLFGWQFIFLCRPEC